MPEVRPIDANALLRDKVSNAYISRFEIEDAPTLDCEPVVYCKDCKHSRGFGSRIKCARIALRIAGKYYGLLSAKENHFCSYGTKAYKEIDDNG